MRFFKVFVLAALLATPIAPALAQPQQQDIATCRAYGFKPGTDNFAGCMMQLDQQRQNDQKQRLRAFGLALGMFGRSLQQPAAPAYVPPRQLNCTSQNFGGIVHTNCY